MSEPQSSHPWNQRSPGETDKAWDAFCVYRDLGADRSIDKAYQASRKQKSPVEQHQNSTKTAPPESDDSPAAETAPRHWSEWSTKFGWLQKVRAYDDHQADVRRKQAEIDHLARITAHRERSAKIGSATAEIAHSCLVAVGKRLQKMTMKPDDPRREGMTETVDDIPIKAMAGLLRAAASIAQISLTIEAEALGVRELEQRLTDAADEDAEEDSETGH